MAVAVQPQDDVWEAVQDRPHLLGKHAWLVVLGARRVLAGVRQRRKTVVRSKHDETVRIARSHFTTVRGEIARVDFGETLFEPGELPPAEAAVVVAVEVRRVEEHDSDRLPHVMRGIGRLVAHVRLAVPVTDRVAGRAQVGGNEFAAADESPGRIGRHGSRRCR